jgi:Ca2+-transporting ATPase
LSDPEPSTLAIEQLHAAVPGRARYHVHGLYHSRGLKHAIERELASHNQVKRVSANPLTGNVLVEFDRRLDAKSVVALLENAISQTGALARCGHASDNLHTHSPKSFSSGSADPASGANGTVADPPRGAGSNAWHSRELAAVAAQLGSSKNGLSEAVAAERLAACGPNRLPELAGRSSLAILLDQFDSMPTALLIAAAGISIFTGALGDALAIGGVLAINAAIGFFTESESENAIRSLRRIVQPSAAVTRDGKPRQVPSEAVVPGDVISLKPGTYVCADARVIEAEHLTVDESALTGESLPVAKTPQTLTQSDGALAERSNMVYMGTRVTGGQGLAMVVATGARTELGLIHKLTGETESPETPMERQLAHAGRQLVLACTGMCGVILGIGLLRGHELLSML